MLYFAGRNRIPVYPLLQLSRETAVQLHWLDRERYCVGEIVHTRIGIDVIFDHDTPQLNFLQSEYQPRLILLVECRVSMR